MYSHVHGVLVVFIAIICVAFSDKPIKLNPNVLNNRLTSIQIFPDLASYKHGRNVAWRELICSAIFFGSLQLSPIKTSALEQQYKLPPIDRSDKSRCELRSSSMGQANAARDKLYDLRECDLKGQVFHSLFSCANNLFLKMLDRKTGAGKDMSGMIGSQADFRYIA